MSRVSAEPAWLLEAGAPQGLLGAVQGYTELQGRAFVAWPHHKHLDGLVWLLRPGHLIIAGTDVQGFGLKEGLSLGALLLRHIQQVCL